MHLVTNPEPFLLFVTYRYQNYYQSVEVISNTSMSITDKYYYV